MTEQETTQEKYDDILDKIVAAYIQTIDEDPFYESLGEKKYEGQFENDKFVSLTTITRGTDFEEGLIRKFYKLETDSPNYRKPKNVTNLCYHLPRGVLDEISHGSQTFKDLRKKGYIVSTMRLYKGNFQVCGFIIREKIT